MAKENRKFNTVEEAIEELHYEVNELARGLVTNRTKTIGVLVYDIQCIFVGNMLHYLGQTLHENGYGMLICDSCNDAEIEAKNLQFLLSRKVDGILVFAVSLDGTFLEAAKKAEVPVVLLDRAFRNKEFDCIEIDNRTAMLRAANKLIRRGHRRIALVASDIEYTGMERMKGFEDALEDAGITIPETYLVSGRHSFELGYQGVKKLLRLPDPPTAVILSNYDTTLGGIMAVNEAGINCPGDISIDHRTETDPQRTAFLFMCDDQRGRLNQKTLKSGHYAQKKSEITSKCNLGFVQINESEPVRF